MLYMYGTNKGSHQQEFLERAYNTVGHQWLTPFPARINIVRPQYFEIHR